MASTQWLKNKGALISFHTALDEAAVHKLMSQKKENIYFLFLFFWVWNKMFRVWFVFYCFRHAHWVAICIMCDVERGRTTRQKLIHLLVFRCMWKYFFVSDALFFLCYFPRLTQHYILGLAKNLSSSMNYHKLSIRGLVKLGFFYKIINEKSVTGIVSND